MIGIYKITSPTGKVYIGQSTNVAKRQKEYANLRNCKSQTKLYNSLVKYGFCEHLFEVVEECRIEELNTRERHWQDIYDVLSEGGLNCILTGTDIARAIRSQESIEKSSKSLKAFYSTPEGVAVRTIAVANTNYAAHQAKRVSSVNIKLRTANTDYQARNANIDYQARTAKTDYEKRSTSFIKAISQFHKDGTFVREWSSVKEAGETLNIDRRNISSCSNGRLRLAGGFIWKIK